MERITVDTEIANLKLEMKEQSDNFKKLQNLQTKRKQLSTQLNGMDKELIKQPELFQN